METQPPASAWGIIDLASCLVNSQLFLDNTHSCFTKMKKKKKMDLSCVQDIKPFVQVGAWACNVVLILRHPVDRSHRRPRPSAAKRLCGEDTADRVSGVWQNFRSQKKCWRSWFFICLWFCLFLTLHKQMVEGLWDSLGNHPNTQY